MLLQGSAPCPLQFFNREQKRGPGVTSCEFERIKRHHKAFGANTWNPSTLDPEPRACMILNRFSRNLGIMYASPSCQLIFKIDPDKAIGKPLLVFLRADDLAGFVEQAELAKSSNVVTHMRFWFQSPSCRGEIPCEAMMFGAADGLVAVLRRCRPFMRRQAIMGSVPSSVPNPDSPHCFPGPRCTCGDNNCRGTPPFNSTPPSNGSSYSNNSSSNKSHPYHRNDNKNEPSRRSHSVHGQQRPQSLHASNEAHCPVSTGGNHPNVMNGFTTNPAFAEYPPSYSSTSSSEASSFSCSQSPLISSYSSSIGGGSGVSYASHSASNFRSTWFSTKTIKSPLQGIPIGSINSIRNLDKDQQRLRPLRSLQDNSLDIVDSTTQLPANYRLRTHYTQEPELEDAELGLMMSRLDTGYDDGEEDDDDEDSVEEVIDCRDTNSGQNGIRNGMRRRGYNSTNEMIEIDMEMEDVAVQNGDSRIKELPVSAPSSAASVKARRRLDEEDGGLYSHGFDDDSPVPGLQVGPGVL
ncbi:hypothetical protein BG015_006196 [Linnemannia schmuckeri]|uniref:Uncharacterized protein n=1 Tax=Linnemannia schmuckeri TaxID=64567 RepID=A0A9P5S0V2_9FUNG|nr:hypothetical protein BG015_006196 [Linnemannia schmuckeri]